MFKICNLSILCSSLCSIYSWLIENKMVRLAGPSDKYSDQERGYRVRESFLTYSLFIRQTQSTRQTKSSAIRYVDEIHGVHHGTAHGASQCVMLVKSESFKAQFTVVEKKKTQSAMGGFPLNPPCQQ